MDEASQREPDPQTNSGNQTVGHVTVEDGATKSHGTVMFLPATQESAITSALTAIGYSNQVSDETWTLGGQITGGGTANVTILPEDGWASDGADFTGMFPAPIVAVETEIEG